jgi:hypothetical protein
MIRARTIIALLCASFLTAGECANAQATPTATPTPARFDACALLSKKEVEAIQGSPIKDTKSSERADGDFRMSQCFFTAAEFSRSVTLVVFQKNPTGPSNRDPLEFWHRTFGRYEKEKKEPDKKEAETKERRKQEGEEQGVPPRKIDKLGDEAFWVPNRFGGTLYALKGEVFISISIGGSDKEEVKLDKSKKLAAKALRGLKSGQPTR